MSHSYDRYQDHDAVESRPYNAFSANTQYKHTHMCMVWTWPPREMHAALYALSALSHVCWPEVMSMHGWFWKYHEAKVVST